MLNKFFGNSLKNNSIRDSLTGVIFASSWRIFSPTCENLWCLPHSFSGEHLWTTIPEYFWTLWECPKWYLPVQSQQWKHQNNVWILFRGKSKGTRTTPVTIGVQWRILVKNFSSLSVYINRWNDRVIKAVVSAIFYKIFIFHQMIALEKLWKMFFTWSKKPFLFSRYLNFCISVFPFFSPCQPLL